MEYLDGCNLKQYVKSKGGKIDVAEARNFIYAIASTLINVHAKNVLHRDISPENIYLVNSSPTTYNATAYKYTYSLSKDANNVTVVKMLMTIL